MTETATLRIAFRVEGDFWNAYLAAPDTMEDALLIGSIRMTVAQMNPQVKTAFMDTMRASMQAALQHAGLPAASGFKLETAPELERAGRA